MSPLKSNRLAWSVAVAALALWATSVPATWGNAAGLFEQVPDETTTSMEMTEPCLPVPPAIAEIMPSIPPAEIMPSAPPVESGSSDEGRFHLCGADPDVARAIEQLVSGRSFSTSLASRGDGCADLVIRVTSPMTTGTATSNLNVSIGSGRSLSMRIVSERGATHVELTDR